MATNPNVIQTSDPGQMFLMAQKQNQDLVKSTLETMRLQQEVDDKKQQNQWTNTWSVLQEQAKNTAGGMAGLIGQNQGLVKQLFRSNGFNSQQADVAVSNLTKTLLTSDAQAEIRMGKYYMKPSAMYEEVIPETVPAPQEEPTPIKDTEPVPPSPKLVPVTPEPAPVPVPVPTTGKLWSRLETEVSKENDNVFGNYDASVRGNIGLGIIPIGRNNRFYDKFQAAVDAKDPEAERIYNSMQDLYTNVHPNQGGESGSLFKGETNFPTRTYRDALGDLDTAYNAIVNGSVEATKAFEKLAREKPGAALFGLAMLQREGYGDPAKIGSFTATVKRLNTVNGKLDPDVAKSNFWAILESAPIQRSGDNLPAPSTSQQAPAQPRATAQGTSSWDSTVKPGETRAQYIERYAVANNLKTVKRASGESDSAFDKRADSIYSKPGANDSLIKSYTTQTARVEAAKANPESATNPVAASEIAQKGSTAVSMNTLDLISKNPQTPQGSKAMDLLNQKGTEIVMHINDLSKSIAAREVPDPNDVVAYRKYLEAVDSDEFLAQFEPITDDFLKSAYGRTTVAEGFQDFLAHGTGGATGLAQKKITEATLKQIGETAREFNAQFGLDVEKFDWSKNVDVAEIILKREALALQGGSELNAEQTAVKDATKLIMDTLGPMNVKDPAAYNNAIITMYHSNPVFRTAWSIYVDYYAKALKMPITELNYTRGWIGRFLGSIIGRVDPSAPTLGSEASTSETGNGAVDPNKVDALGKRLGF